MKTLASAHPGPFKRGYVGLLVVLLLAAVALFAFLIDRPAPASAHCDSVNGPVVLAAQAALEDGDVNLILPYVKEEQEAELRAAFDQATAVRAAGGDAQALADRYFFETAVRLHRLGEGASYTGLKDHTEADPALEAAEGALTDGSLDEVYHVLDAAIREEVEARYQAVLDARAAEAKKPNVETARARVEAELGFETYIAGLGAAIHEDGHTQPATGTDHTAHTP